MVKKDGSNTGNNLGAGIDTQNSYEPKYMQLVNILKQQLATGNLYPGDQLPSESQLCSKYQVSPMTVRRAINILADQGIVDTAQGRGTFVKALKLETATFFLQDIQDILNDTGTSVTILEACVDKANSRVAGKLKMPVGERVIYIRRLLAQQNQPLLYHREYMVYDPSSPIVESELSVTSLRGLFRGKGESEFKKGLLKISAAVINSEESKLLDVPEGSAAFDIEHIFYDYTDSPMSWGWFICRGDKVRFTTRLGFW